MVDAANLGKALRMSATGREPSSAPSDTRPAVCCRKPMSAVTVTDRGVELTLRSCTSCGRHVWERDGQVVDRSGLLEGVATFLEQPRPKQTRRRRARPETAAPAAPAAPAGPSPADLLAGFVVHGTPRD